MSFSRRTFLERSAALAAAGFIPRLLTADARLWILDEVLTSLDDTAVNLSREFITEHLKNGGMAIVATHQDLNLSVPRIQQLQLS